MRPTRGICSRSTLASFGLRSFTSIIAVTSARVQSAGALEAAWSDAAGELMAKYTRVGAIRRNTLEVLVANSTLLQELGFQKQGLLNSLAQLLPDEKIENLRFRVGNVE